MKKILSFDISSSTIGWSLLGHNNDEIRLIEYGYIKPMKKNKGTMSSRLNDTFLKIKNLVSDLSPDDIAVEDYVKRFTKNKSSANTIIILSTFNEVTCLACYQALGKDVYRYPVSTVRSHVGKLFEEKMVSKDDIYSAILDRALIFKISLNRINNPRKENEDIADSIAVGLTHVIKENPNVKKYYI